MLAEHLLLLLQAVGEWLQRSLVILSLICVPISAGWLLAEPLLLASGQSADLARMTGAYIRQALVLSYQLCVSLQLPSSGWSRARGLVLWA